MRIIVDRPPLWDEINTAFNVEGKPIVFAFGGIIYNPTNAKVPIEIIKHEEIHGQRQGPTADHCFAWWRRYIAEPGFRLQEELPAHQAEYQAFCKRHGDRNARAQALDFIAGKLASPLYGGLIGKAHARKWIVEGHVFTDFIKPKEEA